MSITSFGYDGSVQEGDWAFLSRLAGTDAAALVVTATTGDMRVRIAGTGTRPVTVGPGRLFGSGVMDVNSADAVLNPAALASGIRWDTVVMDRNWSGAGGTSALAIRTGTATKAITLANTTPGVHEDQAIALIKLDSTLAAVQQVIDLRAQAEKVKIYATAEGLLLQPAVGMAYALDTGHHYLGAAGGWLDLDAPAWQNVGLPSSVVGLSPPPAFCKINGIVYMRGVWVKTDGTDFAVGGGTGGLGYSLGVLPAGFRPGTAKSFPADFGFGTSVTATQGRIQVAADGTLLGVVLDGGTPALSAVGVTFPAEQ